MEGIKGTGIIGGIDGNMEGKENKPKKIVIAYRHNDNLASAFSGIRDRANTFIEFPPDVSMKEMAQWALDFSREHQSGDFEVICDMTVGTLLEVASEGKLKRNIIIFRQGTEQTNRGTEEDNANRQKQALYMSSIADRAAALGKKVFIVKRYLKDHVSFPADDENGYAQFVNLDQEKRKLRAEAMKAGDSNDAVKEQGYYNKIEQVNNAIDQLFADKWIKYLNERGVENVSIIESPDSLSSMTIDPNFLEQNLIIIDHHVKNKNYDVYSRIAQSGAFISAYPESSGVSSVFETGSESGRKKLDDLLQDKGESFGGKPLRPPRPL